MAATMMMTLTFPNRRQPSGVVAGALPPNKRQDLRLIVPSMVHVNPMENVLAFLVGSAHFAKPWI